MTVGEMLLVFAPGLSSETLERRTFFIDFASLRINRRVFGEKADQATALLAAHLLTRFPASGANANAPGGITSEKVGELSATYGSLAGSGTSAADLELMTTTFGAQFVALRRAVLTTPLVV